MALSVYTLALFLFFVPGLIFRAALYHGTIVRRDFFSSNPALFFVSIIFYASFVALSAAFICWLTLAALRATDWYHLHIYAFQASSNLYIVFSGQTYYATTFIAEYAHVVIIYFLYVCIVAFIMSKSIRNISPYSNSIGRVIYGPLERFLNTKADVFLISFVLSKIEHNGKRIVYGGLPTEIGFKGGNDIEYVVLTHAVKFFLKLGGDNPATTFQQLRHLDNPKSLTAGILYISGDEIENVHFQGWEPYKEAKDAAEGT